MHSREIWNQLGLSRHTVTTGLSIYEWVKKFLVQNSIPQCRTFCYGIWAIWADRNKFVHEGHLSTTLETALFIKRYLQELDGVNSKIIPNPLPRIHWQPPTQNFVKINFDAGYDKNNKRACFGVVIQDFEGNVLYSKTRLHKDVPSSFAAKAMAAFDAIELGLQLGFSMIEVEGDSLTVIRKLQDKKLDKSVLGTYIYNIRGICSDLQNCLFKHIAKHANGVAHILATECLKREEDTYLVRAIPFFAQMVVETDKRRFGYLIKPTCLLKNILIWFTSFFDFLRKRRF